MRFGMDFGGTNLKAGLFDETGETIAFEQTALRHHAEGDLLANLLDYTGRFTEGRALTAGGLAIRGLVAADLSGVAEDNIDRSAPLAGLDLRRAFSDALSGIPFVVENDARAYAWGEWRFGAGQGTTVMACHTIGTGVGGALVAHGRPYTGADPLGGILGGHISIDRNGPECTCGHRGCLEMFCSAPAFCARVHAAHPGLGENEPLALFFERLRAGHAPYQPTLDAWLDDLSIGVVNTIHAYGPERVVIGGGVMNSADLILPGLTERVHRRAWTVPRGSVGVVAAALGNRAAALGVAFHPALENVAAPHDG